MNIVLYSNKIDEYLKHDNVIDFDNAAIIELADTLFKRANNEFASLNLTCWQLYYVANLFQQAFVIKR
ncbi:MAG: hypothetical protein HDT39_10790 [Lachnospiraceae bacterium]|nr:hypothetical protein [Lachnospiraceae bacterium]